MNKFSKGSQVRNEEVPVQFTLLSQTILDMLMAIQRSEQVFRHLARKRREFQRMDKKTKSQKAEQVAHDVVRFAEESESQSHHRVGPNEIKRKIIEELRKK